MQVHSILSLFLYVCVCSVTEKPTAMISTFVAIVCLFAMGVVSNDKGICMSCFNYKFGDYWGRVFHSFTNLG